MNWDAVGAVAELAGAIAVFLTLLYLAAQIRQSNRLALAQHREMNRVAMRDITDPIIRDKQLSDLIEASRENLNGIDRSDQRRVRLQVQNELLTAQSLFIRGKLMGEPRMERVGCRLASMTVLTHHIAKEVWEGTEYDAAFTNQVEKVMKEMSA